MSWFDIIGVCCLIAGVSAVNFLASLRAVATGKLPGWHFTIVAVVAIAYIAAGTGIIAREAWRYYPLVAALLGTALIWVIGAKTHWGIARRRWV